MRILFLGDIVGNPGREFLKTLLPMVRKSEQLDCVFANGENAAGGSSLTSDTAKDLIASGVDIITSGDHIFKKKEAVEVVTNLPVLRPLNYGTKVPGAGWMIKDFNGVKVAVINLIGRVFMQPLDCPFIAAQTVLADILKQTKIIIVDMHAEATSEKIAMGYFLAGKVSAVLGTHTHVPTADEKIINNHTAYISDLGMTGSCDSVLGREKDQIIERFVTNMPVRFNLAQNDVRAQGVILEIDNHSGQAISIKRVEYKRNGD